MSTKELSKQEVFNKVYTFLSNQGRSAHSGIQGELCKYRMEDECGLVTKCAVGCLIPEDRYHPDFEDGVPAGQLVVTGVLDGIVEDTHDMKRYLETLQSIHDANVVFNSEPSKWIEEFKEDMYRLAEGQGFNTEVMGGYVYESNE